MLLELLPTLLGVAASGKLTPFIIPTLIKVVIIPLLNIINTISKGFMFVGLLAYTITMLTPLILTYFGKSVWQRSANIAIKFPLLQNYIQYDSVGEATFRQFLNLNYRMISLVFLTLMSQIKSLNRGNAKKLFSGRKPKKFQKY